MAKKKNIPKKAKAQLKQEDKPDSKDRVPTGIPGLDDLMSGGFEANSVNIISGGAGTGKSIFAMQFLVNGTLMFNEPGVYITFEEEKDKLKRHMAKMGWDLDGLEKENKLVIIEYAPDRVQKMLSEGGGDIEWTIDKIKARRVVIDSVTAFSLLFKDELMRRQALLDLFRMLERWKCTSLLVVEHESEVERHSSLDVEFEVDGVILMYYIRKGDVKNRALEILKLRGSKHSSRIFPMKITDEGIRIYPEEAVF